MLDPLRLFDTIVRGCVAVDLLKVIGLVSEDQVVGFLSADLLDTVTTALGVVSPCSCLFLLSDDDHYLILDKRLHKITTIGRIVIATNDLKCRRCSGTWSAPLTQE